MTPQIILYIIIGITVISYLFSQLLDFLNLKSYRKDIPEEVAGMTAEILRQDLL